MNYLLSILSEIGLTDVIDILIVAFIFYRLYAFFTYTRAIQILKGALLFLLIQRISSIAKLHMVNYFLETIVSWVALAIVILFQPELRRALEHLGRNPFITRSLLSSQRPERSKQVDEILSALKNLSATKTGALIVLEGDTGLNDIIETGTMIDSQITSALIENIFTPNTPLHDGAMILRNDRILAAGCLLPLSNDRSVSRDLGTRHRAAIGMSANSDALILVVSEETGTISTARDNELERFITEERLEEILKDFYNPQESGLLREMKQRRS